MLKHLQNWGALYILAVMFLGSLAGQYLLSVTVAANDCTLRVRVREPRQLPWCSAWAG
jgi:hypothetical protein